MKNVKKNSFILTFILTFFIIGTGFSQATSQKLKKEQDRLETKISNTKSLLNKSKSITEASLNELKIIDNQIKFREELLNNFDNQIRGAELQVTKKDSQIKELYSKLSKLKKQYKKLLIYAYKHRNKYGKMMYIFSSDSYYKALKRNKYLEKISEVQKKQFLIIRQHQGLIKVEISEIQKERAHKLLVLDEKKKEKEQIEKDKEKQQVVYQNFKSKENELLAELKEDEMNKVILKEKINIAIKKEIAEATIKAGKAAAEAKKKKEQAAEAKKKAQKAKNAAKANPTTPSPTDKPEIVETTAPEVEESTKEVDFAATKESAALDKSFEINKGKLPWPVDRGTITEGFGKNAHPTLDNVFTNNSGIDISAPKGAQVRAVFEGEVTSILNIPGAGKVVIIKHGNYRTVYTNLQDTYVSKGSKVNTKQSIGSLIVPSGSSVSVAHFEIHLIIGSSVQTINPTLWVSH
jgi:septal ring factor EnvC (AmiA/AmiB activator)